MTCCTVGERPDIDQINQALRAKVPYRKVALEASERGPAVSNPAMWKHRAHLLGAKKAPEKQPEAPPSESPHAECSCPISSRSDLAAINQALRADGLLPTLRALGDAAPDRHELQWHRQHCLLLSGAPEDTQRREPHESALALRGQFLTPPNARNYVERVGAICSLILERKWSSAEVTRLAGEWGLHRDTVRDYAAAAGAALALDRGSLEVQRAASIAETERLRELALKESEDSPRDLRAALAAQRHGDQLRGLLEGKGSTTVHVAIVQSERAQEELLRRLAHGLQRVPGALAVFSEIAGAMLAERRAAVGAGPVGGEEIVVEGETVVEG